MNTFHHNTQSPVGDKTPQITLISSESIPLLGSRLAAAGAVCEYGNGWRVADVPYFYTFVTIAFATPTITRYHCHTCHSQHCPHTTAVSIFHKMQGRAIRAAYQPLDRYTATLDTVRLNMHAERDEFKRNLWAAFHVALTTLANGRVA